MSGDVQPRKRKDKKRKKDELGVEEPRGTAAVLGEGDVFIHSHHEYGTGGHWCAKIIFFSLLAVLVTLIGLIILENRGLTELEANSVESRYSGVLDGWLEDTPDDDHHDENTLELLKHHDDEDDHDHDISQEDEDETSNLNDNASAHDNDENEDDQDNQNDQEASIEEKEEEDDDDEYDNDDDDDENDERNDDDERSDDDDDAEHDDDEDDERGDNNDEHDDGDDEEHIDNNENELDNDESEEPQLQESDEDNDEDEPLSDNEESGEENDDSDLQKVHEINSKEDDDSNFRNNQVDDDSTEKHAENSHEDEDDDEEYEENEEKETDSAIEVEKLEKAVSDEGIESDEQPPQETDEDDKSEDISSELPPEDNADEVENIEDEEFLEDDIDVPLPVVEPIVAPKGKPLPEVEDEPTTTKPADTLADEEEYEKQQEELRKEQAKASHVWLKLAVGGALLVATHAVVSRAITPRDETPASEVHAVREDTPTLIDRRMTLIPEGPPANASPNEVVKEIVTPVIDLKKSSQNISITPTKEESEDDLEEEEETIDRKDITKNKEMFSDDEDELEEEEEVNLEQKREIPKQASPVSEKVFELEPADVEEDVPDDVEIIDDEHLEEELEEEENDEDEISDVDDAELLTRLEAKYGRLPEPERTQTHKDGGNSVEEDWPGDPRDKYWRQQLDEAEEELRQDWLD